jgi:hypothetical protein
MFEISIKLCKLASDGISIFFCKYMLENQSVTSKMSDHDSRLFDYFMHGSLYTNWAKSIEYEADYILSPYTPYHITKMHWIRIWIPWYMVRFSHKTKTPLKRGWRNDCLNLCRDREVAVSGSPKARTVTNWLFRNDCLNLWW